MTTIDAGLAQELPAAGRVWTITTLTGDKVTGYLPAWAVADPSQGGVPLDRLSLVLDDINHHAPFDGIVLDVVGPDCAPEAPAEQALFFNGGIDCNPHAQAPEPGVPVANLQILSEYWMFGLDPAALTELAAKLYDVAKRIDNELRPQLIAVRADWAKHLTI